MILENPPSLSSIQIIYSKRIEKPAQKMKEHAKKLKNHSVKCSGQEVHLKEPWRIGCNLTKVEGTSEDEMYFVTQEGMICRVLLMSSEMSSMKFRKELLVYGKVGVHSNMSALIGSEQFEYKKNKYGMLLYNVQARNSAEADLKSLRKDDEIVQLLFDVLSGLMHMHSQGLVFLNISTASVCKSTEGKYCLFGMQKVIQNVTKWLKQSISQKEYQSNPLVAPTSDLDFRYQAPEQLDAYSKQPIGCKADIFALGCLAYQLAYNAYPFATPLAAISCHYAFPQNKLQTVNELISKCLKPVQQRTSGSELLDWLRITTACKQINKKSSVTYSQPTNFVDKFKDALTKMTKESESWIVSYTEDGEAEPDIKYVENLIRKLNKNEKKSEKINEIICRRTVNKLNSPCSCLKTISLMWNLLRMGPAVLNSQDTSNNFRETNNIILSHFKKSSPDGLVQQVSRMFMSKQQLMDRIHEAFQGNFHIANTSKITTQMLQSMAEYLNELVQSYKRVSSPQWKSVETTFKGVYLDQMYDLASVLILIIVCFGKDIENKKKCPVSIGKTERILEDCLKAMKSMQKPYKLHLITSLEGSLSRYRSSLDFDPLYSTKQACIDVFKTGNKALCSVKLPQSYRNQNLQRRESKSPKSTKILEDYHNEQDEVEVKQIMDCDQVIVSKQPVLSKKISSPKKEVQNLFGGWNIGEPAKKAHDFDFFAEFQNTEKQKSTESKPSFDFSNIWGELKEPKKQVSFDGFSFDKPVEQSSTHADSSGNKTQSSNKSEDLMFFTNDDSNKGPVQTPEISNELPKLIDSPQSQLQSDIISKLNNPDLKQLIKTRNIVVPWEQLSIERVIGVGSAGQVYVGTCKSKTVAIKKVKPPDQNPSAFKQFQREVVTLIRIGQHPYLVSLQGISKHKDDFYLVLDYCEGGNLFELLHKRLDLQLSWKIRTRLAKQIAQAMLYLHTGCGNLIIHRDLKSLNILIQNRFQSNQEIRAKVTDFGLSRNPDAEFMTSALGTLVILQVIQHWMAPQLLLNRPYSSKVDVYSYGVVLWEICCRTTPYKQFKIPLQIMNFVTANNGRPDMRLINAGCPDQLKQMIGACLQTDQRARPNFQAIVRDLAKLDETL